MTAVTGVVTEGNAFGAIRIPLEMFRLLAFLRRTDAHAIPWNGTRFVKDYFVKEALLSNLCVVRGIPTRSADADIPAISNSNHVE